MYTRLSKILVLALLLLVSTGILAQDIEVVISNKIDSVFAKCNAKTPGAVVAVLKDGELVFQKGYGSSDIDNSISLSAQSTFHEASVSKQIIAFSIYLLESKGLLSFDDDIKKYITDFPDYGTVIKIKHLLSHTSGIKDQFSLLSLTGMNMDAAISNEQINNIVYRQKSLNFKPGEKYAYSNSDYTLLVEIIEKVSGQSIVDFTKQNIFDPLKMDNSSFASKEQKLLEGKTNSYEKVNGKYEINNDDYYLTGTCGLIINIEDLTRWANNFNKPKVGDEQLIANFNQISTLDNREPAIADLINGETIYHCKGQFTRVYRGQRLYANFGQADHLRTCILRFPDQNLPLLILSNDRRISSVKTGLEIAEIYLKDALWPINPLLARFNKIEKRRPPVDKSKSDLSELIGKYESDELESTFEIKSENDVLTISHEKLGKISLEETMKDGFSGFITFPIEVLFIRNSSGIIESLNISNSGASNCNFKKIK